MFSLKPIVVVCGPSGAGKSTLIKRLLAEYPAMFGFSVSHTTRPMRAGEVDGADYHFLSVDQMQKDIRNNKFIEYAKVHSNFYGTSFQSVYDVTDRKRRCILDIDVQGVESVKKCYMNKDAYYIFICPSNVSTLEKRLGLRGTESEQSLATRLTNAINEYKYRDLPNFWDSIIVNDDIDTAYKQFSHVILQDSKQTTEDPLGLLIQDAKRFDLETRSNF